MSGPCDDLRVIDLSSGQPGGIATMVLADFGAEVIKVEPPGGDPARALPAAPMWLRGKRSVVLDLEREDGRARLHDLVRGADVVVSSYRGDEAVRLGADYATLSALNPALVQCSITAWGPRGQYAGYPDDELVVAAKSGRMAAFSGVVRREGPAFPAVQVGAHAASQSAIAGILAALLERDRSGLGQHVETSLLQGTVPYDLSTLVREQMVRRYPQQMAEDLFGQMTADTQPMLGYQPLMASDGRWIQLANLLEHLFHSSIDALGLIEDVLGNPEYAGAPNGLTPEGREEVRNMMLRRAQERPAEEWMRRFVENGNVAADYIGTAQQALDNEDMRANGEVVAAEWPGLGTVRQLGPLARLTETPARVGSPPPAVGQHTDDVLAEAGRRQSATAAPSTNGHGPRAPLDGITVLEFATIIAAPLGASFLADMGARVIKVEPTNGGDPMRGMGGNGLGQQLIAAKTTAGKESICIDLKTPEARQLVDRLIAQDDVIVHNYRPGVPERLGIGYEQACAIRPDIVWVSANGYGPDGPGARRPAAHPIPGAVDGGALMQAGAGWPGATGDINSIDELREAARWFSRANEANPDPNTSCVIATATVLGLYARRRTGRGQRIYTSMLGANAYANADDFLSYEGKPPRPEIDAQLLGTHALRRLYRAQDGWVFVSIADAGAWQRFCETTSFEDPGGLAFSGPYLEGADEGLADRLEALFATRDAGEWERTLIPAGVACVQADEYRNAGHFFLDSAHARENGFTPEAPHAVFGEYQRWAPLVTFSRTPSRYGPGVLAGEHTDALLHELGYDDQTSASLRGAGVVWSDTPLVLTSG